MTGDDVALNIFEVYESIAITAAAASISFGKDSQFPAPIVPALTDQQETR